ncbi:hypothetical protein [Staphylococcus epidermidis]|nr:hypothetical protein [Staphylococcus epidermidis]
MEVELVRNLDELGRRGGIMYGMSGKGKDGAGFRVGGLGIKG